MIEFEVYIDDNFAFSQRSDGLIVSTQPARLLIHFPAEARSSRQA